MVLTGPVGSGGGSDRGDQGPLVRSAGTPSRRRVRRRRTRPTPGSSRTAPTAGTSQPAGERDPAGGACASATAPVAAPALLPPPAAGAAAVTGAGAFGSTAKPKVPRPTWPPAPWTCTPTV